MAAKGRPKKVDIPIQSWEQIFNEHIPTGSCIPTELWKVSRITVNSLTSDWPAVKKNLSILVAILEKTNGDMPRHVSMRESFIAWLKKTGRCWRYDDADACTFSLRVMLRSIRNLKKNQKPAPKSLPQLQPLIDMCNTETETASTDSNTETATASTDRRRQRRPARTASSGADADDDVVDVVPEQPTNIPVVDLISFDKPVVHHDLDLLEKQMFSHISGEALVGIAREEGRAPTLAIASAGRATAATGAIAPSPAPSSLSSAAAPKRQHTGNPYFSFRASRFQVWKADHGPNRKMTRSETAALDEECLKDWRARQDTGHETKTPGTSKQLDAKQLRDLALSTPPPVGPSPADYKLAQTKAKRKRGKPPYEPDEGEPYMKRRPAGSQAER